MVFKKRKEIITIRLDTSIPVTFGDPRHASMGSNCTSLLVNIGLIIMNMISRMHGILLKDDFKDK